MPKTIKQLAQDMNCSYEAVRQQVNRYRRELAGHISYLAQGQTLDDYACEFLRSKRKESPISVVNIDRNERMKELEDELRAAKDVIIRLQGEQNRRLEAENTEIKRLIAENAQQRERLTLIAENTQKAVQEAVETTRKAVEEEKDREIAQIRQEAAEDLAVAQKEKDILQNDYDQAAEALEQMRGEATQRLQEAEAAEEREHQALQKLAEKEKALQDLENRSRWQRFLDVFK